MPMAMRAERAVRGGVRVTAHDGHARLGQAQHRGERVDDALIGVAQRAQAHAELLAVLLERASAAARAISSGFGRSMSAVGVL